MRYSPSIDHQSARACEITTELWQAGPPESDIRFALRHLVIAEIAGHVARWRATLRLDFEHPSRSSLAVIVDAASLETGATERDDQIRSEEFLNVAAYPEIRFRSRQIRSVGPGRYEVAGDLTIRNVTRDVTFTVEALQPAPSPTSHEAKLDFVAHATIDRQAFGLHWNQDLDSGGIIVGDQIQLAVGLAPRRIDQLSEEARRVESPGTAKH